MALHLQLEAVAGLGPEVVQVSGRSEYWGRRLALALAWTMMA